MYKTLTEPQLETGHASKPPRPKIGWRDIFTADIKSRLVRGYDTPRPDVQVLAMFISDLERRGNMSIYSAQAIVL